MKKILIPIDFSETSSNAIKYAIGLFKYDMCEITLMHAYADDVYRETKEMTRANFEEFKYAYQRSADRDLKKEIAAIHKNYPNPKHKYKWVSCFTSLVDEINEIVETDNMDLVIMGTKGKTAKRKITFGSNTLQVIKYVKCPVLAVPVEYTSKHPQKIIFPTDYMLPFKGRELTLLSSIAMSFMATINFLYVSEFTNLSHRQLDNKSFLDCSLRDNKVSFIQKPGKDLTKVINKTIIDNKPDMLVMVNQRHSYLENILYNSTIEKIGLEIKIPFLVLQNLYRK